jgi:ABC-type transport system involved in multi-copper enzyme maturation permease subunit
MGNIELMPGTSAIRRTRLLLPLTGVVRKELRTRMRSRNSLALVTVYMALLGIVLIVFLIKHSDPGSGQSSQVGSQLLQTLAISQLCLILFVTPASMAGAVSGERQQRTWDLLRVTRLTSFDIVWAKLLAGLTVNLFLLFASLPLLSSAFLFGAIGLKDVLSTFLVFIATISLLCVISLVVSAVSPRPATSVIVSVVVSILLGFGLSLLVLLVESEQQGTGITILTQLGSLPSDIPPLAPWAHVDPMVALLSTLPNGRGGTLLGRLGQVHHAFGLPWTIPLWAAFCLLSLAISVLLLALSSVLIHFGPPWLNRPPA